MSTQKKVYNRVIKIVCNKFKANQIYQFAREKICYTQDVYIDIEVFPQANRHRMF